MSLAPHRKGLTWAGTFPAAIALVTFVKAASALLAKAGDVFFRMDLRCSGRIPLGPAADPFGKERAAEKTSDEVKTLADMVETGGGGWALLGGGCFCCISARLAGEYSARPHDVSACTALVYCPS